MVFEEMLREEREIAIKESTVKSIKKYILRMQGRQSYELTKKDLLEDYPEFEDEVITLLEELWK